MKSEGKAKIVETVTYRGILSGTTINKGELISIDKKKYDSRDRERLRESIRLNPNNNQGPECDRTTIDYIAENMLCETEYSGGKRLSSATKYLNEKGETTRIETTTGEDERITSYFKNNKELLIVKKNAYQELITSFFVQKQNIKGGREYQVCTNILDGTTNKISIEKYNRDEVVVERIIINELDDKSDNIDFPADKYLNKLIEHNETVFHFSFFKKNDNIDKSLHVGVSDLPKNEWFDVRLYEETEYKSITKAFKIKAKSFLRIYNSMEVFDLELLEQEHLSKAPEYKDKRTVEFRSKYNENFVTVELDFNKRTITKTDDFKVFPNNVNKSVFSQYAEGEVCIKNEQNKIPISKDNWLVISSWINFEHYTPLTTSLRSYKEEYENLTIEETRIFHENEPADYKVRLPF
jgi:hypothetical protein